jgi:hypothetical protein
VITACRSVMVIEPCRQDARSDVLVARCCGVIIELNRASCRPRRGRSHLTLGIPQTPRVGRANEFRVLSPHLDVSIQATGLLDWVTHLAWGGDDRIEGATQTQWTLQQLDAVYADRRNDASRVVLLSVGGNTEAQHLFVT